MGERLETYGDHRRLLYASRRAIEGCVFAADSDVLAGGAAGFLRVGVLLIASTLAGRDHKSVYPEVRASSQVLERDGGQGRNRTTDTRIFSSSCSRCKLLIVSALRAVRLALRKLAT